MTTSVVRSIVDVETEAERRRQAVERIKLEAKNLRAWERTIARIEDFLPEAEALPSFQGGGQIAAPPRLEPGHAFLPYVSGWTEAIGLAHALGVITPAEMEAITRGQLPIEDYVKPLSPELVARGYRTSQFDQEDVASNGRMAQLEADPQIVERATRRGRMAPRPPRTSAEALIESFGQPEAQEAAAAAMRAAPVEPARVAPEIGTAVAGYGEAYLPSYQGGGYVRGGAFPTTRPPAGTMYTTYREPEPSWSPFIGPPLGIVAPAPVPLPAEMNPIGSEYEADRAGRPGLRPEAWIEEQHRRAEEEEEESQEQAREFRNLQRRAQQEHEQFLERLGPVPARQDEIELPEAGPAAAGTERLPPELQQAQRAAFQGKTPTQAALEAIGELDPMAQFALTQLAPVMEREGISQGELLEIARQHPDAKPGELRRAGYPGLEAAREAVQLLGEKVSETARRGYRPERGGPAAQQRAAEEEFAATIGERETGQALQAPFFGEVPVLRELGGVEEIAAGLAFPTSMGLRRGVVSGVTSGLGFGLGAEAGERVGGAPGRIAGGILGGLLGGAVPVPGGRPRVAPIEEVPLPREGVGPAAGEAIGEMAPVAVSRPPVGPEPTSLRPERLTPPPVAEAVTAPAPALAGGAPLSRAEIDAASQPARVLAEALPLSGKREGQEVWRRYYGALQHSRKRSNVLDEQAYRLARDAGLRIQPASAHQSDDVIDVLDRIWLKSSVGGAPPERRPLIEGLYERVEAKQQALQAADPEFDIHRIEEYMPHSGLFKPKREGVGGVRGFLTRPGFAQERRFIGTLREVLEANPGREIADLDPVSFVSRFEASADNYIASLEAIHAGRATGMIRTASEGLAGWRTPEIAPFRLRQKLQGWVAEPGFATRLEQMFGRSAFDGHGFLRAAKTVRELGFMTKTLGGTFQGLDLSYRQIFGLSTSQLAKGTLALATLRPGRALSHYQNALRAFGSVPLAIARNVPAVDRALSRAALNDPKLAALYRNGSAAGLDPSVAERSLRQLGIGSRFLPIPGIKQVLDFMSTGWYAKFHETLMEQGGLVHLEDNLRKGLPLEEAARRAAEKQNVLMSSIPAWQSAVKHATSRDFLKFPIFATGEFEAWFRIPFQAPAEFVGIVGSTVLLAEMLNYSFTGHFMDDDHLNPVRWDPEEFGKLRKGPQAILDVGVPGVTYNTGFLRPELPFTGPDGRKLFLDLLGQADTPFRFGLDPLFAIQTRLGQAPSAIRDIAAITYGAAPPFGERVRGPLDFLKWMGQEVLPISVAGLGGTEQGRIGLLGAGVQVGGVNISAESLRDLRQRIIDDELGQGNLVGRYDQGRASNETLIPTDRDYLKQHYPNVFREPGEAFREETLGGLSGREQSAVTGLRIATAREGKEAALSAIARDITAGRYGDVSDQEARMRALDDIKDTLDDYQAAVALEQRVNPDYFKERASPKSYEGRVLRRYFALLDKLPDRPKDEDWARHNAEFDGSFSETDKEIIARELGVGDHAAEREYRSMSGLLGDYYYVLESEDASEQTTMRLDRRLENGYVDGILWAFGATGSVTSPEHVDEAIGAYKRLYGVQLNPEEVPISAAGQKYHGALGMIQAGTFNFADEGERSKAASSIDEALPTSDQRRTTYEGYLARLDSEYYTVAEGTPRTRYRVSHPEVDGILWALGKTTTIRSEAGRRAALEAFRTIWGVTPPAGAARYPRR